MAKILIVDDDAKATELLEKLVKMGGHQSSTVNDSTKAVDAARAFKPDLILMDLMMPDLNGFDLTKLFNQDPSFSRTPIIVISAMEDADAKSMAYKLGAHEYITKPFNIEELNQKMQRLLGKSR